MEVALAKKNYRSFLRRDFPVNTDNHWTQENQETELLSINLKERKWRTITINGGKLEQSGNEFVCCWCKRKTYGPIAHVNVVR